MAYYVSGTGSDGYTTAQAQNSATPWQTIRKALMTAPSGAEVQIRGGSYPRVDCLVDSVVKTSFLTVKPYPGETVTIAGLSLGTCSYLRFSGLKFTSSCILGQISPTRLANHWEFINCVSDCGNVQGTSAFSIIDGSYSLFDACTIKNLDDLGSTDPTSGGNAILYRSAGGPKPDNVTIKNTLFQHIAADTISFGQGATNVLIDHNEWDDCGYGGINAHPDGIDFQTTSNLVTISNNKVRDTFRWLMMQTLPGATGVGTHTNFKVFNNDVQVFNDFCLRAFNAPGLVIANNTLWTLDPLGGGDGLDLFYHRNPSVGANLPTTNVVMMNNIVRRADIDATVTFAANKRKKNILISSAAIGARPGATLASGETSTAPTFVNLGAGDLHLATADAQAKNQGNVDAAYVPTTDRDGNTRPASGTQPDIGAYEFGGVPSQAVADTLSLSDAVVKTIRPNKAEPLVLADANVKTFNPSFSEMQAVADNASVGDAVAGVVRFTRSVDVPVADQISHHASVKVSD